MNSVKLDATGWSTPLDFLNALRTVIGSPDWQGSSPAAFIDTIFWDKCNRLLPPYSLQVVNADHAPRVVVDYIELMADILQKGRADCYARTGTDIDVALTRQLGDAVTR